MYRVISCVVRRGCLSWPVHSLAKTLLAFALFHFVLQGQTCLFSRYLLISYSCIPIPYDKNYFFFILVLILDGHVGLHRIFQLQLLQHWWLEHRLGLLWYWIVCLGNEHKSFCQFWDCTQVLHLDYLVDYKGYFIILRDPCPQ